MRFIEIGPSPTLTSMATRTQKAKYEAQDDSLGRTITREHGDAYIDGIQPRFDALKAGHSNPSWNWVCQDALLMFYDILFGHLNTVDREITAR